MTTHLIVRVDVRTKTRRKTPFIESRIRLLCRICLKSTIAFRGGEADADVVASALFFPTTAA